MQLLLILARILNRTVLTQSGTISTMDKKNCFHCGLPIPPNLTLSVRINNKEEPMCCAGCQTVAQTIVDSGLDGFYKHRTAPAPTADEVLPDFLQQLSVYDEPELQKSFVSDVGQNQREAALILEGITCPACVWMNEQHLKTLSGVIDIQANFSTRRLHVRWDDSKIKLSQILKAIHEIGYKAHPFDPKQHQEIINNEKKLLLKRLGLAGVLGMQVMMLAIALYTDEFAGSDQKYKHFFYWVSLILTLPVVLFSARAFFEPAIRDLKHLKFGMDVPVSLGILFAFFGSIKTTITGTGEIYYDSVVMFTFFLLLARYLELIARKRATETSENLIHITPATALRMTDVGEEMIPVARLNIGDRVLIKPGETIPADGHIVEGRSSVDESLLSGENLPISRQIGDQVVGGSINIESPLQVIVDSIGQDSLLSRITSLMERSQMEKPAITKLADHVAGIFVPIVLILATLIGAYWWSKGDPHWFETMLSMLVVTCPCALSLATPAAMTVATDTLMKLGILVTRGHAIETLSRTDHFIFDKTGTLTEGKLTLTRIELLSSNLTENECLTIASALERHSEHPVAQAIITANKTEKNPEASEVMNSPGGGLTGVVTDQKYVIGNADHIAEFSAAKLSEDQPNSLHKKNSSLVFLADKKQIHAVFILQDHLRADAREMIDQLKEKNKKISLLSGDSEIAVKSISDQLDIGNFKSGLKPDGKLNELKRLQEQGEVLAMIGDGVNDAPVLAGAQVSIAMGSGAQIARANADLVLLKNQLPIIVKAIDVAEKTVRIIKQNMIWAVAYNLIALPVAAMGLLQPWMAAIGMSLSSLLVVTNALRIKKQN